MKCHNCSAPERRWIELSDLSARGGARCRIQATKPHFFSIVLGEADPPVPWIG
jgi:hypothetical protein